MRKEVAFFASKGENMNMLHKDNQGEFYTEKMYEKKFVIGKSRSLHADSFRMFAGVRVRGSLELELETKREIDLKDGDSLELIKSTIQPSDRFDLSEYDILKEIPLESQKEITVKNFEEVLFEIASKKYNLEIIDELIGS
jgi:hypothetical protein